MELLPGNLNKKQSIDQMIRVNHAGEYGANRIYAGQMSVLKGASDQKLLQHMAEQEKVHLEYFNKEIQKRKVRPSAFLPLWHILGYSLGAATAALGKNAAMICTKAVEEVIDKHYQEQITQLQEQDEIELVQNINKFREEEVEHKDIAQENMKNLNLGHKILYDAIKLGCKFSIKIAKHF